MKRLLLEVNGADLAHLVCILGRAGYGIYFVPHALTAARYRIRPESDSKKARRRRVNLFEAAGCGATDWRH